MTKWQHLGILKQGEDKLPTHSSTVFYWNATGTQILVLHIYMLVLLKNGVNRCPVSCARITQKFGGKENKNKNMKRTNGVLAAYDAFLLRVLQIAFGCTANFNTFTSDVTFMTSD